MRGLPPVPDDVLRVELDFDVNGRRLTTGWWMLVPGLATADTTWLQTVTSDVFFYVLPGTTGVTHSGTSLVTCRLLAGSPLVPDYTAYAPPNHGAYTGGQADAIASGIYIATSSRGRGSGSRLRIPGCPDDFITDNWLLSSAGVSQLLGMCTSLTDFINHTLSPTLLPVTLGTLQRQRGGAPLGVATFDPALQVVPSFKVEFLGRRLPRARWVSPL